TVHTHEHGRSRHGRSRIERHDLCQPNTSSKTASLRVGWPDGPAIRGPATRPPTASRPVRAGPPEPERGWANVVWSHERPGAQSITDTLNEGVRDAPQVGMRFQQALPPVPPPPAPPMPHHLLPSAR